MSHPTDAAVRQQNVSDLMHGGIQNRQPIDMAEAEAWSLVLARFLGGPFAPAAHIHPEKGGWWCGAQVNGSESRVIVVQVLDTTQGHCGPTTQPRWKCGIARPDDGFHVTGAKPLHDPREAVLDRVAVFMSTVADMSTIGAEGMALLVPGGYADAIARGLDAPTVPDALVPIIPRTFAGLQGYTGRWQDRQFPESTEETAGKHLGREVAEVRKAILRGNDNAVVGEELADCLHLLFAIAHKRGLDLLQHFRAKLAENIVRPWGEPDGEGVREHVRSALDSHETGADHYAEPLAPEAAGVVDLGTAAVSLNGDEARPARVLIGSPAGEASPEAAIHAAELALSKAEEDLRSALLAKAYDDMQDGHTNPEGALEYLQGSSLAHLRRVASGEAGTKAPEASRLPRQGAVSVSFHSERGAFPVLFRDGIFCADSTGLWHGIAHGHAFVMDLTEPKATAFQTVSGSPGPPTFQHVPHFECAATDAFVRQIERMVREVPVIPPAEPKAETVDLQARTVPGTGFGTVSSLPFGPVCVAFVANLPEEAVPVVAAVQYDGSRWTGEGWHFWRNSDGQEYSHAVLSVYPPEALPGLSAGRIAPEPCTETTTPIIQAVAFVSPEALRSLETLAV